VGGAAEVRLTAFDSRSTPLLPATVTVVSPDALVDPATGRAGYVAQVEVSAQALQRHPQLRLQSGMPAEVFVTTPARTLLHYLLRPVRLHAWRALREP
jgi:multidrug efflux pump subunit AcrA (membrane-fusion protein)